MPVLLADLANPDHQAAILDLLDMYSRDEFGHNQPLSDQARADLHPRPRQPRRLAPSFSPTTTARPVGLAICFVGFSSFRAKPLLNIHDIAVRPETRGKGIGRQLLQAVAEDAPALGCCKLTLEVRATDNLRAKALCRDESGASKPTDPGTWFWTPSGIGPDRLPWGRRLACHNPSTFGRGCHRPGEGPAPAKKAPNCHHTKSRSESCRDKRPAGHSHLGTTTKGSKRS